MSTGTLYDQIAHTLLPGMSIPEPIRLLFQWIEANGTYTDTKTGKRIGFLSGGTSIEFFFRGNEGLKYWFGHERPEVLERICVFARTGADGSMAAFWLDDSGHQKIVHLGSGSGSTLVCVLAVDPVDFLRLIAIGYEEICWDEEFLGPPLQHDEYLVNPHTQFQDWVSHTFGVTIPTTASEIVVHPSHMSESNPEDEFAQWVKHHVQ